MTYPPVEMAQKSGPVSRTGPPEISIQLGNESILRNLVFSRSNRGTDFFLRTGFFQSAVVVTTFVITALVCIRLGIILRRIAAFLRMLAWCSPWRHAALRTKTATLWPTFLFRSLALGSFTALLLTTTPSTH